MKHLSTVLTILAAGIFVALLRMNSILQAAETVPATGGEIQTAHGRSSLPPVIVWATHQKPNAGFTEPDPLDFSNHVGYVSLFDGVDLKGWDGNPKFWRVENGAIVGHSSPQNPCGNTYLVYRGMKAKDFTLKFEMKIVGNGGSGFQYRSQTGIPWSSPMPPNVISNTGTVNLNWMMTGPQADFWPVHVYTGQFYSENTPMRIVAWRGQVVDCYGAMTKVLMGNIGDRKALGRAVKLNEWNQYTVIVRGHTFIHIVNGQLMSVLVDDDPASSNNQAGLFGIELESYARLYVRNIWVEKLD
jgi:3-keto-disaccharide hydrolase